MIYLETPTRSIYYDLHVLCCCCCSVTQLCPTLCDPMDCTQHAVFSVHHHLPELAQTHVHGVGDAIQQSHPLSPWFCLNYAARKGIGKWHFVSASFFLVHWDYIYFRVFTIITLVYFIKLKEHFFIYRKVEYVLICAFQGLGQLNQFSHSVVSNSLRPHESQHARTLCPSPAPRVYPNSCPLSQ